MKQLISNITLLLTLFGTLLVGCEKPIVKPEPQPVPGQQPNQPAGIQVALQLPAGATAGADSAILVLQSGTTEKLARVKLQLNNNRHETGVIQLPAGSYQLTQVKITNAKGRYVYATPRANSAKASLVSTALPVSLSAVANSQVAEVQLAAIASIDRATNFGYPEDAFDSQELVQVQIRPSINVGGYVYDYVDGQLEITWYDQQQQPHIELLQLVSGNNKVGLPKDAVKFHFVFRKWNVIDEMELPASAITPDLTITLGGAVAARKLKEEQTWNEAAGEYRLFSRKTYEYNAQGQLLKTLYYQKLPQFAELQLQMVENISYENRKVSAIQYFDGAQRSIGFLKFTYSDNGRISNMEKLLYDNRTYAAVEYGVENGKQVATIDYLYDNGNTLQYRFTLENGNKLKESGSSSTGGFEGGTFTYDSNINPYHVLGVQDIFLRHLSKNNQLSEQKSYGGNIPSNVPYQFDYQYDAKGYPTQLIKKFKSYTSGTHLYNAKTQYSYLD